MFYHLSRLILKILGWKVTGLYPSDVKKLILVAAPHTSNWDFPLGLMIRSVIKKDVKYIGKASLFRPPLGWILKPLGGMPVDRTKSNNFVEAVVKKFNEKEELAILFAAEGSRKRVEKFKTGFYHIARLAKIPILPTVLDYDKKEFRFLDLVWPTSNFAEDLAHIESLFRGTRGYYVDKSFM